MTKSTTYLVLGLGLGMGLPSLLRIPYSNIVGWVLVGVALVMMFKK